MGASPQTPGFYVGAAAPLFLFQGALFFQNLFPLTCFNTAFFENVVFPLIPARGKKLK